MKPTEYELNEQGYKQLTEDFLTYMVTAPTVTFERSLIAIGAVAAFECYKPFKRYSMGYTTCD